MPLVSVVIPSYNRADLLDAAATSVLEQTFTDLELIVVDDGSSDHTRDVCARLCRHDPRVRYIYQNNKGLPAARNTGIHAAQGQYVAFLDSDDLWAPTKLAKQLAVAEGDRSIVAVYCDWSNIDEKGRTWPRHRSRHLGRTLRESLLYENVIDGSASAVLMRRECLEHTGLFDESMRSMEDWDMWLRVAERGEFSKVPEVLVYLRNHAGQMHRNTEVMVGARLRIAQKLREWALPPYRKCPAQVTWHHHLWIAERYLEVGKRRRALHALGFAVRSHPLGTLSPRPWYVLCLAVSGRLYPLFLTMGGAFCRFRRVLA